MDNAAKALIMAGAILISLALVGLGVYIFSLASDLEKSVGPQIDIAAIQTTNKQLEIYAGVRKRGSEVKTLINLVNTLNTQDIFPVDIVYAGNAYTGTMASQGNLTWAGANGTILTATGAIPKIVDIRDSALYEVQIYDELASDGYLDTIHIRNYSEPTP